jgi:hypothetical protein
VLLCVLNAWVLGETRRELRKAGIGRVVEYANRQGKPRCIERLFGSYRVWRLTAEQYKALMKETRSKGPSQGRVGIVKRAEFERLGTRFAKVPVV